MSKQRCTYIGSSHSFLLLGRLRLCTTSPSLLRNATSPSRRGLGKTGKLYAMPRAPLLGELSSGCETERLYRAGPALQNYTQLIFYQQFHLDARVFVIFSGGEKFNSQMQQLFAYIFVHFIAPQQGRQHSLFCWQPIITHILLHYLYHITPFSTIYLYFALFIYPSCRNAQFPQALPKYDLA